MLFLSEVPFFRHKRLASILRIFVECHPDQAISLESGWRRNFENNKYYQFRFLGFSVLYCLRICHG